MFPYIFLLVIPGFSYYLFTRSPRKELAERRTLAVFFFVLFLLLALRATSVGRDVVRYEALFNSVSSVSWSQLSDYSTEYGFALLYKLISLFTDNFQIVLAVIAAMTVYPIYRLYSKNVENVGITLILFLNMTTFVMLFSGLRQSLAIAFGCLAMEFVQEKKWVRYAVAVAVAMTFHTSAFMLLLLPFYYYRLKRKSLYFFVPTFVVCLVFNKQIFAILQTFFSSYSSTRSLATSAYTMIILLLLFVVYSIVIPNEATLDASGKGFRNMAVISLGLQLFAPVHHLASRLTYYFLIFIPLMIPKIMKYADDDQHKLTEISKIVISVFFLLYFFYYAYNAMQTQGALDIFPYRFFWEAV